MKHTWKRLLGVSLALMLLLSCLCVGGLADDLDETALPGEAVAELEPDDVGVEAYLDAADAELYLASVTGEQYLTTVKPAGADKLKFNADGTFKIIQIADLQEIFLTQEMTKQFLRWLAKTEKPDLFVLTGDNFSSPDVFPFLDRFVINHSIDSFMDVFDDIGIPVTAVLGNHDAEDTNVTRWQVIQRFQAHESFVGYAVEAADGTDGAHWGTHCLPIKDSTGTDKFALWMFDTGANVPLQKEVPPEDPEGEPTIEKWNEYNCVSTQQMAWFNGNALKALPGFTFQHIIVPEVYDYLTPSAPLEGGGSYTCDFFTGNNPENIFTKTVSATLPTGVVGELREKPCPSPYNYNQFAGVSASGVLAMFFGHDHKNTFELPTEAGKPKLVNSPTSGFGAYGDKDLRGVRVITLDVDDLSDFETEIVTYEDFVDANGLLSSLIQGLRLMLMDWRGLPGYIIDWIFFVPCIWFLGLLGL